MNTEIDLLKNLSPSKIQNLLSVLEIIDEIKIKPEGAYIKLNNNLMIETNNSIVTIAKGYNVILAKEIHLNPVLDSKPDLKKLEVQLTEAVNSVPQLEQHNCELHNE